MTVAVENTPQQVQPESFAPNVHYQPLSNMPVVSFDKPTKRSDEWLKAQQEIDESRKRTEAEGSQGDGKSLYEVLQLNKVTVLSPTLTYVYSRSNSGTSSSRFRKMKSSSSILSSSPNVPKKPPFERKPLSSLLCSESNRKKPNAKR